MTATEHICYFNPKNPDTSGQLGKYLLERLEEQPFCHALPVFLCIGSDRVTGDSLGPLVGSSLEKRYQKSIPVFGTLEMPVHALNLEHTLYHIRKLWYGHPLIAIDASIGTRQHLGYITAGKGSLRPGAGVDKSLTAAGDFFITGIVASFSPFSHLVLQSTRLSAVMPLVSQITDGISFVLDAL